MKNLAIAPCGLFLVLAACSEAAPGTSNDMQLRTAVVERYATLVHDNYELATADAKKLKAALDAFVASPDETTLASAKAAWVAARPSYLQTEAFRFYGGPIDSDTVPRGGSTAGRSTRTTSMRRKTRPTEASSTK